jgi:molybdopterin-guanine dinucleotide biosynthesis protein A
VRSGIVLVGGEARRAEGKEKYFFRYRGERFIDRMIRTLSGVVDEIILVAKDPEQCNRFRDIPGIRCVSDIRRGIGPVGGLQAGALAAKGDILFVSACDMPCINAEVVELLFRMINGYDAVIPAWKEEMIEPLHAVYRRAPLLAYLDYHEGLSLRSLVKGLHARYIDVREFRELDPILETFTNINRLADLKNMNMREDR